MSTDYDKFVQRVSRFLGTHNTNSTLRDDVVVNDEFQDGSILGTMSQTKDISSPKKKDDGISGSRYAIMYKSVRLDGPFQVQDPGIVDVVSNLKQDFEIYLHYGFAAGTTGLLSDTRRLTDVTKMSRFYELLDQSDSPTTEREGHIALVEMVGVNHGKIKEFMEEGNQAELEPRSGGTGPVQGGGKKVADGNVLKRFDIDGKFGKALNPEKPKDPDELRKWNSYSNNSGNPFNIDIVTKTIAGQTITLARTTMAIYEKFHKLFDEQRNLIQSAGGYDPGPAEYMFGEAFRINGRMYADNDPRKRAAGGRFRDGLSSYDPEYFKKWKNTGTHTAGNALDMHIKPFFDAAEKTAASTQLAKEYARNYINLIVKCAILAGFKRFGVGRFGSLHMDIGIRLNDAKAHDQYWVYDGNPDNLSKNGKKATIGYSPARQKNHKKNGWMSEHWPTPGSYGLKLDFLDKWDPLQHKYGPANSSVSEAEAETPPAEAEEVAEVTEPTMSIVPEEVPPLSSGNGGMSGGEGSYP